jgi:hypothetical protein
MRDCQSRVAADESALVPLTTKLATLDAWPFPSHHRDDFGEGSP